MNLGGFQRSWKLLVSAGVAWNRDNVMRLSAAVAMYTLLSLSALLLITIKTMTLILSEDSAARQVRRQIEGFLGPLGSQAVEGMIADTMKPESGIAATILSALLLLVTASGAFNALRDSLNSIWGIVPKEGNVIWVIVRERFLSVVMVFAIGILLLASNMISFTLLVMSKYALGEAHVLVVAIDIVASTLFVTALFAILFRILPEARMGWSDVLFGAAVTAILFKMGQYIQALYFTHALTASAYGAAGSFMVVLLWVYFSCWILLYGAELIKERIHSLGRDIEPTGNSVRISKN